MRVCAKGNETMIKTDFNHKSLFDTNHDYEAALTSSIIEMDNPESEFSGLVLTSPTTL